MTTNTPNLSLVTYNDTTDTSGSFTTWIQDISGSSDSNMTKIDLFAGKYYSHFLSIYRVSLLFNRAYFI